MSRLLWVGVGAAGTVMALRKARELTDRHVPAAARGALGTLAGLGAVVETARRELAAGTAEREAELRAALMAGADVDRSRATVDAWRAGRSAGSGGSGTAEPVTAGGSTALTPAAGAFAPRPATAAPAPGAPRPGSAAAARGTGRRPEDPDDGPTGYSFF